MKYVTCSLLNRVYGTHRECCTLWNKRRSLFRQRGSIYSLYNKKCKSFDCKNVWSCLLLQSARKGVFRDNLHICVYVFKKWLAFLLFIQIAVIAFWLQVCFAHTKIVQLSWVKTFYACPWLPEELVQSEKSYGLTLSLVKQQLSNLAQENFSFIKIEGWKSMRNVRALFTKEQSRMIQVPLWCWIW